MPVTVFWSGCIVSTGFINSVHLYVEARAIAPISYRRDGMITSLLRYEFARWHLLTLLKLLAM